MSPTVYVFLLSLIFVLHISVTSSEKEKDTLDPKEKNALLTFLKKINHDPTKLDWKESEPACGWKGITCDPENKTVIHLRLKSKSLAGEIPPDTIALLTSLRVLSLRVNKFSGSIPPDFEKLTTLTTLSLYNNSFTGQLPFIDAKELFSFNVSMNKLNTSIPSFYSKFDKSAFSTNVYVCGAPFNITCNSTYPDPKSHDTNVTQSKSNKKEGEIVGISVGSGLVLLTLLCCVKKKYSDDHVTKRPRKRPPVLETGKGDGKKKNSIKWFDDRVYGFDVEELLNASAEFLGEGSVGKSYKQVVRGEGKTTTVRVKRLKDVMVTEFEFGRIIEGLWRMNNTTNNLLVVPLRGYYYSKEEKWLVYDYMPRGSLALHLHGCIGSRRTHLNWDNRMRIALSVARGLAYLHIAEKVVHGNLKSSNILLGEETNNEAFLSDYGLNKLFDQPISLNHRVTGYQAPELLNTQKVTESHQTPKVLLNTHNVTFESDVYSFGVLLVELLTGKNPKQALLSNEGGHLSKLVESVVSVEPEAEIFDADIRKEHKMEEMLQLLRIAKKCVSIEPNERPKMDGVVNMMDNMWLRPSSDDQSRGYDDTPSTDIQDTPSTITP